MPIFPAAAKSSQRAPSDTYPMQARGADFLGTVPAGGLQKWGEKTVTGPPAQGLGLCWRPTKPVGPTAPGCWCHRCWEGNQLSLGELLPRMYGSVYTRSTPPRPVIPPSGRHLYLCMSAHTGTYWRAASGAAWPAPLSAAAAVSVVSLALETARETWQVSVAQVPADACSRVPHQRPTEPARGLHSTSWPRCNSTVRMHGAAQRLQNICSSFPEVWHASSWVTSVPCVQPARDRAGLSLFHPGEASIHPASHSAALQGTSKQAALFTF